MDGARQGCPGLCAWSWPPQGAGRGAHMDSLDMGRERWALREQPCAPRWEEGGRPTTVGSYWGCKDRPRSPPAPPSAWGGRGSWARGRSAEGWEAGGHGPQAQQQPPACRSLIPPPLLTLTLAPSPQITQVPPSRRLGLPRASLVHRCWGEGLAQQPRTGREPDSCPGPPRRPREALLCSGAAAESLRGRHLLQAGVALLAGAQD